MRFTILLFTIYYLRKEFNCMSTLKTLTNYTQYAPQLSFSLSFVFSFLLLLSYFFSFTHFPHSSFLTPHSLPLTSYSLRLS